MTLELFDGTKVNGRLIKHNTQRSPYQVTVTLITEYGEEKVFDLKNVKDITG